MWSVSRAMPTRSRSAKPNSSAGMARVGGAVLEAVLQRTQLMAPQLDRRVVDRTPQTTAVRATQRVAPGDERPTPEG